MIDLFDGIARFYDLLYSDKDTNKEVLYIKKLIDKYSKSTKSILELGSGTGRHGFALAKMGYEIDGIERSKSMVDAAKTCEGFSLFEGDIKNLILSKTFDCVISIFHVMSYQISNIDVEKVLNNAHRHLKKEGIFIFDFWYGPAVLNIKPSIRVKTLSDEKFDITRIANPTSNSNANTVNVKYDFIVEDKFNHSVSKFKELHPMRYFFLPEMELFASKTGFEILSAEEWLTGESPSDNTWGTCIILQKK